MMLDIEPLVREMAPGLLAGRSASVACIATTRRKYLVFDAGAPARPVCVVEYGDRARLQRTAHVLRLLSARLPGMVPAVISCAAGPDGDWVLIQQGLEGVPWFRVADTIHSAAGWRSLLERSLDAMITLHTATRSAPTWTATIDLGEEITVQAAYAAKTDVPLSKDALRLINEWRRTGGHALPSFRQHGDFSLNNLLVGRDTLAIIDFDEFGETAVPLHDAFGLALSFVLTQDVPPLPRADVIRECVRRARVEENVDASLLPGLLLHHLVFRINQCYGLYRRARLRTTLLGMLEELAANPTELL